MTRRLRRLSTGLVLLCVLALGANAQESRKAAIPIDPVDGMLSAFETHQIVSLTEGTHGNEQSHEFRLALVRNPRFAAVVDDIVVEFGNSRYQGLMDRFVNGGDVPYEQLRHVWQDTTQPHDVWDRPIYEEFFRAIRRINGSLSGERRIRIVLADPPIDWSQIKDFQDLLPWLKRRPFDEAAIVEREVLAKGRRALLIAGAGHHLNGSPLLKAIGAHGVEPFKVWATTTKENLADLEPSVGSWPRPSLTLVKGTVLGQADIRDFYGIGGGAPAGPLEKQFDAILYLGPPSSLTESHLAPELCSDRQYLDMRLPRLRMAAENGAPDWLKDFLAYCDGVAGTRRRR